MILLYTSQSKFCTLYRVLRNLNSSIHRVSEHSKYQNDIRGSGSSKNLNYSYSRVLQNIIVGYFGFYNSLKTEGMIFAN